MEKREVSVYVIVMPFMRFYIPLDPEMAYRAVMSTIDHRERAEQFARILLDSSLVTCVNRIGPMMSLYHWQDAIARDEKHLLLGL